MFSNIDFLSGEVSWMDDYLQEVMLAKFQPHASQMHLKWAEISYCTQDTVYSNLKLTRKQVLFLYYYH